jgi:hypothetical protein
MMTAAPLSRESTSILCVASASLLAQEGGSVVVKGRSEQQIEEAVRRIQGQQKVPLSHMPPTPVPPTSGRA